MLPMAVAWYKPLNKPIPLSIKCKLKLVIQSNPEQTNIGITTLEYRIDLSRLKVTAFDKSKNIAVNNKI